MSHNYTLKPQEKFIGSVKIQFSKKCQCCGNSWEEIPSFAVANSFAIWWNCACGSTMGVTWKFIPQDKIEELELPFVLDLIAA